MEPTSRGAAPQRQLDYYAIGKTIVTTIALVALCIDEAKEIRPHIKWAITPIQKNSALVALTTICFIASAYFWGPLTKPAPKLSDQYREMEHNRNPSVPPMPPAAPKTLTQAQKQNAPLGSTEWVQAEKRRLAAHLSAMSQEAVRISTMKCNLWASKGHSSFGGGKL